MADRILMNAAGSMGGPAVIELARRRGCDVVACDIDPVCPAAGLAEHFFVDKPLSDPDYAAWLVDEAREHGARWILPNSGIGALAREAEAAEAAGVRILCPEAGAAAICEDKALLFERLVPDLAPRFHLPRTLEDFDALMADHPAGTLCAKPRTAEGSRGFYRFVKALDRGDILDSRSRTRTTAREFRARLEGAGAEDVLESLVFCDFLPGRELTVVACAHPGGELELLPFERLKPGPDGVSVLNKLHSPEMIRPVMERVMARLPGLRYYLDVQVMEDGQGRWRVVDLNPRISGLVACCPPLDKGGSRSGDFPRLLPTAPEPGVQVRLFSQALVVG